MPGAWLPAVLGFVAALALAAVSVALWQAVALRREMAAAREREDRARQELREVLERRLDEVDRRTGDSQRAVRESLEGATRVFGEVRGQLGQVSEMAGRVETLGRSIQELEGILKVPKLRGILGERALESLLAQVLPRPAWEVQHRFSDGRAVDAVVRVGDRLVPIDAKFPLEAFRRHLEAADDEARKAAARELQKSLRLRIEEIATRYIRPAEGTLDFALMFIPSEAVYAEMVAGEGPLADLLEHALSRRVLPVSPSTLYAYLSTVATGLRGLEVEANARRILDGLGELDRTLARFEEEFAVVGRHLGNASSKYEDAARRLDRVRLALERVGSGQDPEGEAG